MRQAFSPLIIYKAHNGIHQDQNLSPQEQFSNRLHIDVERLYLVEVFFSLLQVAY